MPLFLAVNAAGNRSLIDGAEPPIKWRAALLRLSAAIRELQLAAGVENKAQKIQQHLCCQN
jgi:hypothetical protein